MTTTRAASRPPSSTQTSAQASGPVSPGARRASQARGGGRPPRRHWPWWLAAFLVLALLGGAAYVAYRTPVLGLRSVEVTARSGELDAQVRDQVSASVSVPDGTPLVGIDLAAVRKRVLAVPEISAASVTRRWPHGLEVSVSLRQAAAVTRANGALYLLDTTGTPYVTVATAPAGLLTIELATPRAGDPATMAALAVVGSLKQPVRGMVASVSARSAYTVTLNLADGRTVLWGSTQDSAKKMQILPAVLAQAAKSYDISDPAYVTTRG